MEGSINSSYSSPGSLGVAQVMLVQLISTLTKSCCDLNPSYPDDQSGRVFDGDEKYDFIIVGAGSAGSAIANRLSEVSSWKILLIEAGPDPPMESNIPAFVTTMMGSAYDWNFKVESSTKSCRSMVNRQCIWSKGKMLGGSSSMNYMLYVRGLAQDYDRWEKLGNPGWSYSNVLKYFQKLEKVSTKRSSTQFHGYNGYVSVQEFSPIIMRNFTQTCQLFKEAAFELGLPYHEDFAATGKSGGTSVWGTVKDGVRASAGKSYLVPVRNRKNLMVMKETLVTKILIDDLRKLVYGVQVHKDGKLKHIMCSKEVILSAGAVNSPKILMLSGVGPEEHLKTHGIPTIANLKVGYNLQDHIALTHLYVKTNTEQVVPEKNDILYNYLTKRTELGSLQASMIFIDSLNTTDDYPDVQFHIMDQILLPEPHLMSTMGFNNDTMTWFDDIGHFPDVIGILPTLLRPKSSGQILLQSSNFSDPPKIISGYLEHHNDVKTLIRGIKFVEKLLKTKPMQNATLLTATSKECQKLEVSSDEYYECYIRNFGTTLYHASGSCKMGPKEDVDAVVDARLKVYQVHGLRVADSSIMPQIVSGNTNVPTIMIGEKAADFIKEDWLEVHSEF